MSDRPVLFTGDVCVVIVASGDSCICMRDKRRLRTNFQHGLVSLRDELNLALIGEDIAMKKEAFEVDAGVSVEVTTGRIQYLPIIPTM